MRTAIVKNRGSKYSPDVVVMNSDTFDRYYLAKDLDNNYLFDTVNGTIAGLQLKITICQTINCSSRRQTFCDYL
jgi:hypothetical protein